MVIRKDETASETVTNARGGSGQITFTHYVKKENLKNARLLSKITVPEGSGIGEHAHDRETEYFIILKGTGIVNDDGIEKEVHEGDVIITGNGAKHSIRNAGSIPLEMTAVIITY